LNKRTKEIRDLRERVAVARADLDTAGGQLRDIEGRVITNLDDLNERTTKIRDLRERVAVIQAELETSSVKITDLEGRFIKDLDNLTERNKQIRDLKERIAVKQADLDTAGGQLRDFEGRVITDLDNLNERTTRIRDFKERVTIGDLGTITDAESTRILNNFKKALVDDPDYVTKRFKEFQRIKEHSLQLKSEFKVFTGVDFSEDSLKNFFRDHTTRKTKEKIAHEITQIVTDVKRYGINDNILDVFNRVEKQIEQKIKLFREKGLTLSPGLEDVIKKQLEELMSSAEINFRKIQAQNAAIEDYRDPNKRGKFLAPPIDIDSFKKELNDAFTEKTKALENRILEIENEFLLPLTKDNLRIAILDRLAKVERIVVSQMDQIIFRWERAGISPEEANKNFRYNSAGKERGLIKRAALLKERRRLNELGEELGKVIRDEKNYRTYDKIKEAHLDQLASDALNKERSVIAIDEDEIKVKQAESMKVHENALFLPDEQPARAAGNRVVDPDELKKKITATEQSRTRSNALFEMADQPVDTRAKNILNQLIPEEVALKIGEEELRKSKLSRAEALLEAADQPVDTRLKLLLNEVIPEEVNIKKTEEELRKSKLTRRQALLEKAAGRTPINVSPEEIKKAEEADKRSKLTRKEALLEVAAEAEDKTKTNLRKPPDSDRNKKTLKDTVAQKEKVLKKSLLSKVDIERLRRMVINHPDTPLSISQSIVLLGGRKIPMNPDGTRMSLLQFINNHPEISFPDTFKFIAAFGHALTFPDRVSTRLSQMYDKSSVKKFFDGMSETKGIKWASAVIDGMMENRAVKVLAKGTDIVIGPGLDFLQIAMTFSDSAFYGLFPDESQILKPDTLKNIISKGVKAQLEGFGAYNASSKVSNADETTPGWPFAYAQYPMIAGPLSDLGMHGDDADSRAFRGDPYYNQVFIDTAVDAIREKMLRDPNEIFENGVSFKDIMIGQMTQSGYNSVINAGDDALVSYVDSVLSARAIDELYGRAFSNVCSYYGGKVYEDYYIMGSDKFVQTGTIKSDGTVDQTKMVGNRRRFQCGFKNETQCTMYANKWATVDETGGRAVYGDYAEWFTSDDIDKYLLKDPTDNNNTMNDPSDPDHPSRPLFIQPAFRSGACIVTTSGNASLCKQGGGRYDAKTHSCIFTPQYCQSIGTCYCTKDGGSCFLPNTTMEALAFFFGTGGVREWIKINGCQSSTCNPNSEMEYSQLATNGGEQWFADMFANERNWGPGLKESIGTPSGAMMFTGAVLGLAIGIGELTAGTAIAAAASAAFSSMVATTVAATVEASAIASGVAAAEAATLGATAASSAVASSSLLGPAAILVAIGAGVAMWVEAGQENYSTLINPTTDEAEYTLGGWSIISRSDGSKYVSPKRMTFADGWVTKPIPYHPLNNRNSPYTKVSDFGFGSERFFDTNFPWRDYTCVNDHGAGGDVSTLKSCLQANPGLTVGQRTCYQNRASPMSPKDFAGPPHWIRAASDGSQDSIWCIPPFPVNNGTNGTINTIGLFDNAIGKPAEIKTEYLTNNTWTDGTDTRFPLYPTGTAARSGNTSGSQWHYQLVYDTSNVCDSEKLWITPYLQRYFSDMTITNMRRKCCSIAMLKDTTGRAVDPKCWGYMSVKFQSWNLKPSTNIPASKTPLKTLRYTPVPTCQAGQYYERIQNKCLPNSVT
jgi:hypothetical protein